jgi:hypothetical protein
MELTTPVPDNSILEDPLRRIVEHTDVESLPPASIINHLQKMRRVSPLQIFFLHTGPAFNKATW